MHERSNTFFHSCFLPGPEVPCGYYVVAVKGFVEELVVNDDPEYQVKSARLLWCDCSA